MEELKPINFKPHSEHLEYLEKVGRESGLTRSQIIRELLSYARRRDLRIGMRVTEKASSEPGRAA